MNTPAMVRRTKSSAARGWIIGSSRSPDLVLTAARSRLRADCKAQRSSVNFPRQVLPWAQRHSLLSYPGFEDEYDHHPALAPILVRPSSDVPISRNRWFESGSLQRRESANLRFLARFWDGKRLEHCVFSPMATTRHYPAHFNPPRRDYSLVGGRNPAGGRPARGLDTHDSDADETAVVLRDDSLADLTLRLLMGRE